MIEKEAAALNVSDCEFRSKTNKTSWMANPTGFICFTSKLMINLVKFRQIVQGGLWTITTPRRSL